MEQGLVKVTHRAAGDGDVPQPVQHGVDDGKQGVVVVDDEDVQSFLFVFTGLLLLFNLHFGSADRNPDFEMSAFAHFGVDVDFAAEEVDKTFYYRHAVTAAFGELVVGFDTHKRLEHFFPLILRNAYPRVDDVENNQISAHPDFEAYAAL